MKDDFLKNFLKKLGWQEWGLLVAIIIVVYTQFSIFSIFQQLPGPLYGGDYYYHYGHMLHIYDGGSVFENSNYLNEYEYYPWFLHLSVASISKITLTSPLNLMIFFPLIITIIAGIVTYFLGIKLFGNKTVALLASFAWMIYDIPATTPTSFGTKLLIPAIVLGFIYADSLKTRIIAGILYGIGGISHVTIFLGTSLFLALFFIYRAYSSKKENKKLPLTEILKKEIIFLIPILIIGILIAMLYWAPPIFAYHGKTLNPWQEYTVSGISATSVLSYLFDTLKLQFFNLSGAFFLIFSLISLLGLYISAKKRKFFYIPLLIFFVGILGILHPLNISTY